MTHNSQSFPMAKNILRTKLIKDITLQQGLSFQKSNEIL